MTLLREIHTIDGASDLETLLRKCRVLATSLKHDELKNWVRYELLPQRTVVTKST
jgi:hypothetical protein